MRGGAGDREVVHRAVDGELSDRSAVEAERPDHEAVRGERDPSVGDLEMSRVTERLPWRQGAAGAIKPSTSRRLAFPPAP